MPSAAIGLSPKFSASWEFYISNKKGKIGWWRLRGCRYRYEPFFLITFSFVLIVNHLCIGEFFLVYFSRASFWTCSFIYFYFFVFITLCLDWVYQYTDVFWNHKIFNIWFIILSNQTQLNIPVGLLLVKCMLSTCIFIWDTVNFWCFFYILLLIILISLSFFKFNLLFSNLILKLRFIYSIRIYYYF